MFALAAAASAAGSRCALVGIPDAGMVAAAEAGMALDRLALIPRPEERLVAVTAALLDGMDLVAAAGWASVPDGARRRLMAQARARGSVLLAVDDRTRWPGADLRVRAVPDPSAGPGGWVGMGGGGHGRLRRRLIRFQVTGVGLPHSGRSDSVWWPGPDGRLTARVDDAAGVVAPRQFAAAAAGAVGGTVGGAVSATHVRTA